MHHVLFAIGKLAVGTFALTPAQSHAMALECQVFAWRCDASDVAFHSSSKHLGVPTVKVRTVRIDLGAKAG